MYLKDAMVRPNKWIKSEWLKCVILFIALFPLVVSPFFYVIKADDHALGSEAGYQYWVANHFQWGTQIIQNIGPLGFIHFPLSFAGFLEYEKTLIDFALIAILVSLVIFISEYMQNRVTRLIFLACFATMNNLFSFGFTEPPEVNHYFMCLLVAYALFLTEQNLIIFFLMAVLALMSLGKGMFLFISPVIVVLASLYYFLQKRTFTALIAPIIYLFSTIVFWVAAGQHLANFFAFLRGSIAFSSGYNDAMANYDSPLICTYIGVLFLLIGLIAVATKNLLLITKKSQIEIYSSILLAIAEIFILFAAYKHGVVASDEYHITVLVFFLFVSFVPFLYVRPIGNNRAILTRKYNFYDTATAAAVFLIAVMYIYSEFSNGVDFIFNVRKEISIWDYKLKNSVAKMQMPKTQHIVKQDTIGYFGELPAPMMYNNFRYKTSPNTISFVGWNHHNMELDAEFYRENSLAPQYLVYQLYNVVHGELPFNSHQQKIR